jgi:integrase
MLSFHHYRISDAARAAGLQKVEEAARNHHLNTTSTPIRIVGTGTSSDNMANDSSTRSTIHRYENVWSGLLDFCIEVGDYDSGILLHRDKCPSDPLPIKVETAIHYLRFHTTKAGVPLLHFQTRLAVNFRNEAPIVCRGDWSGKSSIGIYRSALSKLHSFYESTKGVYLQRCEGCAAIPFVVGQNHPGCILHLGAPRIRSIGNIVNHNLFILHIKTNSRYVEKEYTSRSTTALLPAELRQLRAYLLNQNTLEGLMIWTMTILGIKLFLRMDEVLNLKYGHFLPKYFVVKPGHVDSLLVHIKGKKDNHPIHFSLWTDHDCPDFCPVRSLLTWLCLSGIRDGFLFPTAEQIGKTTNPTANYGYDSILSLYKRLMVQVLHFDPSENPSLIIGTHMLRKTGFLFAYWGIKSHTSNLKAPEFNDIDHATIQLDARHKDISGTKTYLSDSGTLHTLLVRSGLDQPLQRVGRYCPIYVSVLAKFESLCRSAGGGSLWSKLNDRSLGEVADWFIHTILKIDKELCAANRMNIAAIVDKSTQYTPTAQSTHKQELEDLLTRHLPQPILEKAKHLAALTLQFEVQMASSLQSQLSASSQSKSVFRNATSGWNHHLPSNPTLFPYPAAMGIPTQTHVTHHPSQTATSVSPPPIRTAASSISSLDVLSKDYRRMINKADDFTKASIAVSVSLELKTLIKRGQKLGEPLKSFSYRSGRIALCVRDCHHGSVQEFIEKTLPFTYYRWECCNGVKHFTTFVAK